MLSGQKNMASLSTTFSLLSTLSVAVVVLCLVSEAVAAPYRISIDDAIACKGTCCPEKPRTTRVIPWRPTRARNNPIIRRSTYRAFRDKGYVTKYRRAYRFLKHNTARWNGQVGVHCAYCAGDVLTGNIHNSDLFFPWHRWFLYWHERMLQKVLNDTDFALPFWDWDNSRSRGLPWQYTRTRTALHNKHRNLDLDNVRAWIESSASASQMRSQVLYSSLTESFFGGPYGTGQGGNFEGSSHAAVHNGVGEQNWPYQDMGDLELASNDPVFYAHHANVDRMWTIWKRLPPNSNGRPRREPNYRDWLASTFMFFDEEGRVRSCNVSSAIDTLNLGYKYEEAPVEWLPTGQRLAPQPSRRLLSVEPKDDDGECTAMTIDAYPANEPRWSLRHNSQAPQLVEGITFTPKPTTVSLSLVSAKDRWGYSPTLYSASGRVCKEGSMNAVVLSIEGVRWFCRKPFLINIFVDNAKANLNTPTKVKKGFLITWQYVPSAIFTRSGIKKVAWGVPLHAFLKLAGKLEKKELTFTFVPYTIGSNGKPVPVTDVPEGVGFAGSIQIKYK